VIRVVGSSGTPPVGRVEVFFTPSEVVLLMSLPLSVIEATPSSRRQANLERCSFILQLPHISSYQEDLLNSKLPIYSDKPTDKLRISPIASLNCQNVTL